MSSTTRVGFLVPGVNDLADEIIYYNNNVTVYEAELPSVLSPNLPGAGNYIGQIKTVGVASPNSYGPAVRFQNYVWNGTAWIQLGAFGLKDDANAWHELNDGAPVASTGTETFQSSPDPGINSVQVKPNQLIRFSCCICTKSALTSNNGSTIFNGKFNLFVSPNSSAQPGPLTPGAVRLSFPVVSSDDGDAIFYSGTDASTHYHYGELLYLPSVSKLTTLGVGAYLSATLTNDGVGTHIFGEGFTGANIFTSTIVVETLGEM